MELLDLGGMREVVAVEAGPIDECLIEVRGTKGSRRYDTCTAISQNRVEQGRGALWDIRLQYLLRKWNGGKKNPLVAVGDQIKLPSTRKSMDWAIKHSQECRLAEVYDELKFGRLRYCDCRGEECEVPEGVRAMICVLALKWQQNEYQKTKAISGKSLYERIENEYVAIKLAMDVYAGKVSEGAISGDAWDSLEGSCDAVRSLARAHNALIKNGRIPQDARTLREEWEIAEVCSEICEHIWDNGIPECDFGYAIIECAKYTRELALSHSGKRAWLVKKYTPFRYPKTKIICPPL